MHSARSKEFPSSFVEHRQIMVSLWKQLLVFSLINFDLTKSQTHFILRFRHQIVANKLVSGFQMHPARSKKFPINFVEI